VEPAVPLLSIDFLKGISAFWIALGCMLPALLFMIYVCFDDARQARAHRQEQAKAGPPQH
jgi:hypothetical protein